MRPFAFISMGLMVTLRKCVLGLLTVDAGELELVILGWNRLII